MSATPRKTDDSMYDPVGTGLLFDQIVYSAWMLEWNFDEQIDGAPPELLYEWSSRLLDAEAYLADIREELEKTGPGFALLRRFSETDPDDQ